MNPVWSGLKPMKSGDWNYSHPGQFKIINFCLLWSFFHPPCAVHSLYVNITKRFPPSDRCWHNLLCQLFVMVTLMLPLLIFLQPPINAIMTHLHKTSPGYPVTYQSSSICSTKKMAAEGKPFVHVKHVMHLPSSVVSDSTNPAAMELCTELGLTLCQPLFPGKNYFQGRGILISLRLPKYKIQTEIFSNLMRTRVFFTKAKKKLYKVQQLFWHKVLFNIELMEGYRSCAGKWD